MSNTMGTIVKVQGPSQEIVRELDCSDLFTASMEAYALAIKANRKGTGISYLTKFLVVRDGKVQGGYYARGLQYTEN
jgi:hypothetical protein